MKSIRVSKKKIYQIYCVFQLLGCPEELLEKALMSKTLEAKGEKVRCNPALIVQNVLEIII